eukprot:Rmarinus@m.21203
MRSIKIFIALFLFVILLGFGSVHAQEDGESAIAEDSGLGMNDGITSEAGETNDEGEGTQPERKGEGDIADIDSELTEDDDEEDDEDGTKKEVLKEKAFGRSLPKAPAGMKDGDECAPNAVVLSGVCGCKPGYEGWATQDAPCTPCSAGTYKGRVGPRKCRACPEYSEPSEDQTMCECDPGFTKAKTPLIPLQTSSTSCLPCHPGSYKSERGNHECTRCPKKHMYSNLGATSLGDCNCKAGMFYNEKEDDCVSCTTCGVNEFPKVKCGGNIDAVCKGIEQVAEFQLILEGEGTAQWIEYRHPETAFSKALADSIDVDKSRVNVARKYMCPFDTQCSRHGPRGDGVFVALTMEVVGDREDVNDIRKEIGNNKHNPILKMLSNRFARDMGRLELKDEDEIEVAKQEEVAKAISKHSKYLRTFNWRGILFLLGVFAVLILATVKRDAIKRASPPVVRGLILRLEDAVFATKHRMGRMQNL